MREYGMIYSAFWTSTAAQGFSDDGKLLGAYLLSCSHGSIAGVCRLSDGYVSDDLNWTAERVVKGFGELLAKGFADRCETTKWVWIRKFLEWNRPENPNQWKAVRKVVGQIPAQCVWLAEFKEVLCTLTGEKPLLPPNPSGTVTQTVSESHTYSDPHSESHSDTQPIPIGKAPAEPATSGDAASFGQDAWRDVERCDPEAMEAWIAHRAASKPPPLRPHEAIAAAKMLAGMGTPTVQRAAVQVAVANSWKNLRADDGKRATFEPGGTTTPRARAMAQERDQRLTREAAELQALVEGRAVRGLLDYREPGEHESADAYRTALRLEEQDRRARPAGDIGNVVADLAAQKRVAT